MAENAMQSMMGAEPMGMAPEPTPEEMAAFEQARSQINPTEFSDEILNASAEIDPAEVQELRQMVMQAQLPADVIEAILDIAEMALADPENYGMMRQEFIKEGVPEELLPAQFDPEYFGALELALQQAPAMRMPMGGEPMGFADGGIVSLKPIAKELQRQGRYGDTILAHITPAEARMLRRHGGGGTTNPVTGLPEFNLFKKAGKVLSSVGKAVVGAVKGVAKGVQKFAKSPVGKIAIAAALFYFAGPLAAKMGMSAVGAAAFKGVVAGFGSSILGGDNFKTALRNGAIGGVVAGAGAGIMGGSAAFQAGSYTGPATYGEQFQQLKQGVGSLFGADPVAQAMPVQPPTSIPGAELAPSIQIPTAPPLGDPSLTIAGNMPAASTGSAVQNLQNLYSQSGTVAGAGAGNIPVSSGGGGGGQNFLSGVKNFFSPGSGVDPTQAGTQAFQTTYKEALQKGLSDNAAIALAKQAQSTAISSATPSALRQYGPLVAGGLGVMALTGGFKDEPAQDPNIFSTQDMMDRFSNVDTSDFGIGLGPTETIYASPQSRPVEEEYADYYASMRQNPYMLGMAPPQTRMLAQGGPANPENFPRRNGAINGPGTATSDSIPAMLSDGEFVFTARAVRGAGGGSRRDGAKRMYQMMKQFERKA